MLKNEGCFRTALPETGEEHEEKTSLGDQKHRPDAGLGEHVHRGARREEGRCASEQCEKEEDRPCAEEMITEQMEGWAKGASNTPILTFV